MALAHAVAQVVRRRRRGERDEDALQTGHGGTPGGGWTSRPSSSAVQAIARPMPTAAGWSAHSSCAPAVGEAADEQLAAGRAQEPGVVAHAVDRAGLVRERHVAPHVAGQHLAVLLLAQQREDGRVARRAAAGARPRSSCPRPIGVGRSVWSASAPSQRVAAAAHRAADARSVAPARRAARSRPRRRRAPRAPRWWRCCRRSPASGAAARAAGSSTSASNVPRTPSPPVRCASRTRSVRAGREAALVQRQGGEERLDHAGAGEPALRLVLAEHPAVLASPTTTRTARVHRAHGATPPRAGRHSPSRRGTLGIRSSLSLEGARDIAATMPGLGDARLTTAYSRHARVFAPRPTSQTTLRLPP